MKEIVFVTGNKGKVATAQKYFDDNNIKLLTYDYDYEEPNINDIEVIAISKVKQAYRVVGKPCIALDSGFYIPNYPNKPNFPGAFPKRELLEKIGIDGLLEIMKNVENRYCYFKEVVAYFDGENIKLFYGISEGYLSREKRGIDINKKWSDLWSVFIPFNCTKTLAEMTEEERNNRKDNHTSALKEFAQFNNKQYIKTRVN